METNFEQLAIYGGTAAGIALVLLVLVLRYRAAARAEREEWERLGKTADQRRQNVSDFLNA